MDHFDLLLQVCLIVISGALAFGLGPMGLVRLFPFYNDERQFWLGLSFVALGVLGFISFAILLYQR